MQKKPGSTIDGFAAAAFQFRATLGVVVGSLCSVAVPTYNHGTVLAAAGSVGCHNATLHPQQAGTAGFQLLRLQAGPHCTTPTSRQRSCTSPAPAVASSGYPGRPECCNHPITLSPSEDPPEYSRWRSSISLMRLQALISGKSAKQIAQENQLGTSSRPGVVQ